MSAISEIAVKGKIYDVKDKEAREKAEELGIGLAEQKSIFGVEETVLAEQALHFTAAGDTYSCDAVTSAALVLGEKYRIIWDGMEYFCTAESNISGGGITITGNYLGNPAQFLTSGAMGDTGEPFFIGGYTAGGIIVCSTDGDTDHTVRIERVKLLHIGWLSEAVAPKEIPCITDEGVPTTETEGAVGCLYMNTLTGEIYKCTAIVDGAYTWVSNKDYVTPQMFGAVGDGVTDDTDAVQTALDSGGVIYFPAGRYKVTKQLTVSKSCRIKMFKPYPATYLTEYPLTNEDNWMGARIETYATDGYGFLIGDAVEIDGLFLRAMTGFSGVLLKLDTTIGSYTYQAGVRLSHIKLENDMAVGMPESMFDFTPNGSYHYILNDIAIGRSPSHPRCGYGFRADLSGTPKLWCNNVFIRNMCIDMHADVAMYIDGASCCTGWVFDGLTIQAYNFDPGHVNLLALKNMKDTLFVGSYLWDTGGVTFSGGIITQENVVNTTCVGCSLDFDSIETGLSEKMKRPENLNIANLTMSVTGDSASGENILILSDGTHEQKAYLPSIVVDDEQIGAAVSNWMDENSEPVEVVGKNKLDVTSDDCKSGYCYYNPEETYWDNNGEMWMTNFIEAKIGDIIRISSNGVACQGWGIYCYDENKNKLGGYNVYSGNSYGITCTAIEVLENVIHASTGAFYDFSSMKYIRFSMSSVLGQSFEDRGTDNLCITINNSDISYEPYETHLEGGLTSYMVLQSPNGTKYTLAVTDDGTLVAEPA